MGNILRSQSGTSGVLAHLGANVRTLRREQGMSQAVLAERAALSRRMLGSIEGEGANVSLSVVDRLATALDVRFSRLVRPVDSPDGRRIVSLAWRGRSADSRAELLGAAPASRETELWLWSLGEGESYSSEDNSDDWHEILFVLEGKLTLRFADHEKHIDQGDFQVFSRGDRYQFVNGGRGVLRFLRNVVL